MKPGETLYMKPGEDFVIERPGYWYLASPYSAYPHGLNLAHREALAALAVFVREGVPVFSPIAHTHFTAMMENLDPLDHALWLPFCKPMADKAEGCLVLCMEGWQGSKGIAAEMEWFRAAGKPVVMVGTALSELRYVARLMKENPTPHAWKTIQTIGQAA